MSTDAKEKNWFELGFKYGLISVVGFMLAVGYLMPMLPAAVIAGLSWSIVVFWGLVALVLFADGLRFSSQFIKDKREGKEQETSLVATLLVIIVLVLLCFLIMDNFIRFAHRPTFFKEVMSSYELFSSNTKELIQLIWLSTGITAGLGAVIGTVLLVGSSQEREKS